MKLTRRGLFVLAAVVAAVVSGALFGARGLNAIAAPGAVALVGGAVQVWRYERPTFERELPPKGERGGTVAVRLDLETPTPFGATVRDTAGDGLDATGAERRLTVDETTIRYDLHLERRGERSVGPAVVVAGDVLGLVATTYRYEARDPVLVRPRVRLLAGPARDDLVLLYGGSGEERGQFDHLRRYERGDPLRDIHWRSSAKQSDTDFVVKAFSADEGTRTVEVVAEAAADEGDAMADAAASVVVDLLASGVRVGLTTPDGRVDPEAGADQRERVLDHLATADTGRVDAGRRQAAQVVVSAEGGEPSIEMDGRTCTFADLAGERLAETPARSARDVEPLEASAA